MEIARDVIVEWVHRWGGHTVIESLIDPTCSIFTIPHLEGFVGYRANRGCAVVFGDPVCAPADREHLVNAFHSFCEEDKKNVLYLVASKEFAYTMQETQGSALVPFGEELFLDPRQDPKNLSGKRGISLRGKLRHAQKNGLSVSEYLGAIPEIEQKIQDVASAWLQHRSGPQIYISPLRLFSERFGKRWFYVHQDGRLFGGLALNYLSNGGWSLDRVMTVPDAPQGTSELLVVSVMETIAQEGCHFLTVGAINGDRLDYLSGFGKMTTFMTQKIYNGAIKFFNLQGKRKFWEKFYPQSTPAFLVFKKPHIGFYELSGLMRALNVSFLTNFKLNRS